jgi:propionyl-CoA carboxylase beta chain
MVRELLSFLPSNNLDDPPRKPCTDPIDRADEKLDTIVPTESNQPYDIKDVINTVVDDATSSRCRSITRRTSSSALRG